jgi:DNA-binding NarL/FixJ family response regulator
MGDQRGIVQGGKRNVSRETIVSSRTQGGRVIAARASGEPGGSATPTRPKILIVEDNLILALEVEDTLQGAGFEVVGVAATADQAVRLAALHRPALAVMDIRLPGARDGIEAAIELRETYGIRSVFASAHSAPDMRERASAARPAGWMTKPYSMPALVALIRDALEAQN